MKSSTASKLWVNSIRVDDRELKQDRRAGTPFADRAREDPQHRDVLAHRHGDARADPHHGADRGDEADGRSAPPTMRPPTSPKMWLPAITATSSWPASLLDRRRVEKHGVERDIEREHDQRAGEQRARQAALRVADLAGDVGRGVPARIGIHHEHEADRERRADDVAEVGAATAQTRSAAASRTAKPATRNATISASLRTVQMIWNRLLWLDAAQMHERRSARRRRGRAATAERPARPP